MRKSKMLQYLAVGAAETVARVARVAMAALAGLVVEGFGKGGAGLEMVELEVVPGEEAVKAVKAERGAVMGEQSR